MNRSHRVTKCCNTIVYHSKLHGSPLISMLNSKYTMKEDMTLLHDIKINGTFCIDIIYSSSIENDVDYQILLKRREYFNSSEVIFILFITNSYNTLFNKLQCDLNQNRNIHLIPIVDDTYIVSNAIVIITSKCINSFRQTLQIQQRSIQNEVENIVNYISRVCDYDLIAFMKENHLSLNEMITQLATIDLPLEVKQKIAEFLTNDRFIC